MKKFLKGLKEFFKKHKLACSFALMVFAAAVIYAIWGKELDYSKATELFCKIVHCEEQNAVEAVAEAVVQ